MAIAFDSAVDGGIVNPGSSLTFSKTCSGENRLLFVSAWGDTTDKITGATYAGISMTLVDKVQCPGDRYTYLFVLHNPAIGANNVVISASSSIVIAGMASSYSGCSQTSLVDAKTTNTASSASSITTSVTTLADNCWTIVAGRDTTGQTLNAGTGTTERVDSANGGYVYDSGGSNTPAGSKSLIINKDSGTQNWGVVMASFAPAIITYKFRPGSLGSML